MIVGVIIGLILGYIGHILKIRFFGKSKNEVWELLKFWFDNILNNLDDFMLIVSILIFITCIIYDSLNPNSDISIQYLNIFSTLIFSWLLTKKSTEIQCKREQEKVAKISYRHLGDLEYTVLTAEQYIKDCLKSDSHLEKSSIIVLERVEDKINLIKHGLNTNKEDWYDLLDANYKHELEEKANKNQENPPTDVLIENATYKTIFEDEIQDTYKDKDAQ